MHVASSAWDATGGKAVTAINNTVVKPVARYARRHWRGLAQIGILAVGIIAGSVCAASVVCGVAVGAVVGAATYVAGSAGSRRWSWAKLATSTAVGGLLGGVGAFGSRLLAQASSAAGDFQFWTQGGVWSSLRYVPQIARSARQVVGYGSAGVGVKGATYGASAFCWLASRGWC